MQGEACGEGCGGWIKLKQGRRWWSSLHDSFGRTHPLLSRPLPHRSLHRRQRHRAPGNEHRRASAQEPAGEERKRQAEAEAYISQLCANRATAGAALAADLLAGGAAARKAFVACVSACPGEDVVLNQDFANAVNPPDNRDVDRVVK